jgi:hypothetical protein
MTGLPFFFIQGKGVEIASIFADTNWITASVAGVAGFVRSISQDRYRCRLADRMFASEH